MKNSFESFFCDMIKDQNGMMSNEFMIQKVPQISKILQQIKDGSPISQLFTICFERTRKILRAFQIMTPARIGGVDDRFLKFAKWNTYDAGQ